MSFYQNIALSFYRNIACQNRLSDEGLKEKNTKSIEWWRKQHPLSRSDKSSSINFEDEAKTILLAWNFRPFRQWKVTSENSLDSSRNLDMEADKVSM